MSPRQIWEVAPHLCGYPTAEARRRLLLVLKAFIDESGKSQPPAFVMAGFIGRGEQIQAFDDAWKEVLDVAPAIPAFHLTDAVFPRDEWRLRRLVHVVQDHKLVPVYEIVLHAHYNAVFGGKIARRMDRPYFFMYHRMMSLILQWEVQQGINEPVDFIFDEENIESDFLQSLWTQIVATAPPEAKKRLGQRPIHVPDEHMPAIQAADIFAGSLRSMSECGANKTEVPQHIQHVIANFGGSPLCVHHWVTQEMLQASYDQSRKMTRASGSLFQHEADSVSRNMDALVSTFNETAIANAHPGDVISLLPVPAKETRRFLLVHTCPHSDSPHLHRRQTNECLAETTTAHT